MKFKITRLAGAPPHCGVGVLLLVSILGLAHSGCGKSPSVTDQSEIERFLNENPDAQNPPEESSDLNSNEYKGIVRTREKV